MDINELFENSLKSFDINNNINNKKNNINNINTKILENSSILFNLEKNKFSLKEENETKNKQLFEQTEEENKTILEYLKKELLSSKKEEFNFSIKNDLSNLFKIFNINNNSSFISTKSEKVMNDIDDYFKDEDSEEEQEKEKKENSESKSVNINVFELIRQDINEINDEMININNKLNDFDKDFIANQRQLNTLIKDSISEQKQNKNLNRDSSKKNLFTVKE